MSPADRYGLLSDIKYSSNIHISFIKYFKDETDIGVWYLLYDNIKEKLFKSIESPNQIEYISNTCKQVL
jgi:hypothetical protein